MFSADIEVCEEEEINFICGNMSCTEGNNTAHSSLVTWLVYLIAILQKKFYISNTAIAALLKILSAFFCALGKKHPHLSDIAATLPTTTYRLQKLLNTFHNTACVRFVVCQ